MDLAFLSRCEHACELSKSLIKEWLAQYLLQADPEKAKTAANKLGDVSIWHSHGRYIGIDKIEGSFYNVMGLPVKELYEELVKF